MLISQRVPHKVVGGGKIDVVEGRMLLSRLWTGVEYDTHDFEPNQITESLVKEKKYFRFI